MYEIRKGSIISESAYGLTLVCEIITDVEDISQVKLGKHDIKHDVKQQRFQVKIISVNGNPKPEGEVFEYLTGGTYGACIEVLEY